MKNKIEFTVPIKRYFQLIFVFGGATFVMSIQLMVVIFEIIFDPNLYFQKEMLGVLIVYAPFFMYTMWLMFGYEKIIIDNETVELIKSNRIITKKKTIKLSEIKSIKVSEKIFNSNKLIDVIRERLLEKIRAFPFWIRMGQLKFQLQYKEITFFNGLSYSEIPIMKGKIEKAIKDATQRQLKIMAGK